MDCDAEIQRNANINFERSNLVLVLRSDTAAESDRLLRIGLGKKKSEFVTANTKRKVRGPQCLPQR